MEDNELKALLRLLDDDDQEVNEHVTQKLLLLGLEGIPRLEKHLMEIEDPVVSDKGKNFIRKIKRDDITDKILEWRKAGGQRILDGWILFSKFLNPDLDEQKVRNEVSRLSNISWLEINSTFSLMDSLKVLNHIFYVQENYEADREDPGAIENFGIDKVLSLKKGNPFSLGMLFLIIGKKLELPVGASIPPGYFVIFAHDGENSTYLDPFNKGTFFTRADFARFLKKIKVPENPSFFKPTSNIFILIHLIVNMKYALQKKGFKYQTELLDDLLKNIEIKFE